MIKINIYRNNNNEIYGFRAIEHGDPIVCSAVSALTLNAINSVESFTDEKIVYDYDEKGGFLKFEMSSVKENRSNHKANLLMKSMLLGLKAIELDYGKHIKIIDKEVM